MRDDSPGRRSPVTATLLVAAVLGWPFTRLAAGDEPVTSTLRFDLTVESGLKLRIAGGEGPKDLEARSRLVYDLTRRDDAKDVAIHSMELTLKENGRERFGSRMSRSGVSSRRGESTEDDPYAKATPQVRAMLRSFDTTALTLSLDASGREVQRTPKIQGPLADHLLGLIDGLLSIHVGFPPDADRWEAPAKLSMGQGHSARGTLRFEKVAATAGGVRVRVTGRLAPAGQGTKSDEIKSGYYTVSGEQVYDPTAREWRSADWSIEVAFDILQNGKAAGSVTGSMKLAMRPAEVGGDTAARDTGTKVKKR
jgi:hypothetical protein